MKKKVQKLTILYISLGISLSACFSPYNFLKAEASEPAIFYFEPDLGSYLDPDYLYIDIKMNPSDQAINVAAAGIKYDTSYLQLEEADYSNSFCKLFIPEITEPANGYFYTACGSWTPATSTADIVRLKFKKLQAGATIISFDNTEAHLHDGLGTAAETLSVSHYLEIVK